MLWKLLSSLLNKFFDYIRWLVPDVPYLSGSGSRTKWKVECWTILKGVSSMEALWEGNGMSENIGECSEGNST